ncbi:glycosyltransferase [Novosphingobium sp. FSY-8]|uniref:Glycosyltransferase n=1 Tax=Novosphingobium ovatum TaxID=1908523 RepID=A0ABW9XFJ0_9SPHN|nr:glycosyltransferase [Novosphingobium ovatum]NBC37319.1 glycosyltransferase [Novosphingobium ovatum]
MERPTTPRISVAMSVYNGERFLALAIESILAQTFGDFEFLILDDGSKDATTQIIQDYAAKDARIHPILRENRGLIVSLNQLLAEARAPIIARMDADDIAYPQRFARQYAFLQANPDHAVVGCANEDIDDHGQPWPVDAPPYPTTFDDFLRAAEKSLPLISHPGVMYRRDPVLSVGGYHAAFRHCEDLDLWLRLASITKLANLTEPLIRYRHYPEQVSSRHATEQQIGAAVARIAYMERKAGRPDPTIGIKALPPIDDLDTLFGRPGVAQAVRARVAQGLLYSKAGLRDSGFDLILRHLREGGTRKGMWRTVARLIRFGEPARAIRLATTLASTATVAG